MNLLHTLKDYMEINIDSIIFPYMNTTVQDLIVQQSENNNEHALQLIPIKMVDNENK